MFFCGLPVESASLPAVAWEGSLDERKKRDRRTLELLWRDMWFTDGTELPLPEQLR